MTAPKAKPSADNIVLLSGEPDRPKWMPRRLHKRWDQAVSTYRQRGMSVKGFEAQLAIYIATLAQVEDDMKHGREVTAATLTQVRQMGREFYDTPLATDQGKHGPKGAIAPGTGSSPFSRVGRRD